MLGADKFEFSAAKPEKQIPITNAGHHLRQLWDAKSRINASHAVNRVAGDTAGQYRSP